MTKVILEFKSGERDDYEDAAITMDTFRKTLTVVGKEMECLSDDIPFDDLQSAKVEL